MNPGTYARLYGPPQSAPRRERPGVVVLACVLWVLTGVSLAWLTSLVGMVALWGMAEGAAVGSFVLECVLIVAGAAATLTVLAFAFGVRRLSWAGRLLLTSALACPVTTGLAIWSWIYVG